MINNKITRCAAYLLLFGAGTIAGFMYGKDREKPDITVNRPEFKLNLTLPEKELIDKYGKKDLEKLVEVQILGVYAELQTPGLKEFYKQLEIKYIKMKMEAIKKRLSPMFYSAPQKENQDNKDSVAI